jgi:hypothetical protein
MIVRTPLALLLALTLAGALAACGGGGGGGGTGGPPVNPTTAPTTTPVNNGRATTAVSVRIPGGASLLPSASQRRPQFISPGTDKLSFFVDGAAAFTNVQVDSAPQPYVSGDGNTKATYGCVAGGADVTCTLTVDTLPGNHTFGVVIKGGSPAIILSEGQATIALLPGNNSPATMALLGVMGSGYIMCDTDAHVAANNGCQGSFDTNTGLYTLTAVAADYEGMAIPYQTLNASPVGFDNGSFSVVETDASANTAHPVVTLSNNGPFTNPGNALSAEPSGGFFVPGTFAYGQHFNVKCNVLGTATLGIADAQQGPTSPVTGQSYVYFPPNPESSSNYPGGPQTLPRGSKWPGNPNYHGGNNPNAIHDLVTVNCDANLVLTLI